ncbi:hypothetical protein GCM10007169_01080 [Shewanella fodinae]|uniref:hypothetical protein n=1 Tax=Shewanella fodinae TaxID=552357 RepID=UPI001678AF15|nr:hypothetical protein [Shewanella fodinae]MCL2905216.1 hypothetical protein [Shewanella fodinae]GGY87696.1 hypothetical protein GCM10007169_01080 [Shewanella fodinae]
MIEFLKGKATALLGIALLVMLGMFLMVKADLSTTTTALTNANAAKQVLQDDSNKLSAELKAAVTETQDAIAERDALAAAIKNNEQSKSQLTAANTQLQQRIDKLLRDSNDDHTKSWAADYVPDDAVRLLVNAANCAQHPDTADCLRTDAGSIDNAVPRNHSGSASNPVPTAKLRPLSFKPSNAVADIESVCGSWQM